MTNPALASAPGNRLLSLDVLRGITIAFMIMVNNNGGSGSWGFMNHAAWNGLTPTDLVFPTFVFVVGASIVFAFEARLARGATRAGLAWHTVQRAAILFLLGIVVNGFPFFHLDHLRIYGVLHGDKIYTIYFSMPGKNWVLQYCAHENSTQVDDASRIVQINIQPPLAPPAAIEQYDFHRPPPQQDSAGSMIILHGIIHEDGSVSDLSTLQGVDATSNAAASLAFSRWKFKPALRSGKPVTLENLVGIP